MIFFLTGCFCCLQVFYKSVKDLEPGEEMLLYARDAVYPENELDAMHTMEDEDGKLPLYLPLYNCRGVQHTIERVDYHVRSIFTYDKIMPHTEQNPDTVILNVLILFFYILYISTYIHGQRPYFTYNTLYK